ncbi:MAG: galactosamine-6-phosphate isomerase [Cyclobacteriaceae bacterium]|nr:galactosamine-6-phosphate isomerase [Cyclobacteriaceae bacterium]
MQIVFCENTEDISLAATNIILGQLLTKKNSLLCLATGQSPTGTYHMLTREYTADPGLFDQLRIIKLDEWGNVAMDHPMMCESYLQKHVIGPLHIDSDRYLSFNSMAQNPDAECDRMQHLLEEQGSIDLCVLGLGRNGHLALNEPARSLKAGCHVAKLATSTLQHDMIAGMEQKPTYGFTLGMVDIMKSKKIILLISGSQKAKITRALFNRRISTNLPASMLWLHPNVICLADRQACLPQYGK